MEYGCLVLPETPKEEGERKTIAEIAEERFWETGKKKRNTVKTTINQRGQFACYVAPTLGRLYPDQLDQKTWETWVGGLYTMEKKRGGPPSESLRNQVYHLGASLVRKLHFWGVPRQMSHSRGRLARRFSPAEEARTDPRTRGSHRPGGGGH